MSGNGTINANGGLVTDATMTINNASGTTTFPLVNSTGTVSVNLSPVSGSQFVAFGAGYYGTGSLTITNGQAVSVMNTSSNPAVVAGMYQGSNGTLNVNGRARRSPSTTATPLSASRAPER